jgi:hypothetical protein
MKGNLLNSDQLYFKKYSGLPDHVWSLKGDRAATGPQGSACQPRLVQARPQLASAESQVSPKAPEYRIVVPNSVPVWIDWDGVTAVLYEDQECVVFVVVDRLIARVGNDPFNMLPDEWPAIGPSSIPDALHDAATVARSARHA